jgi:hypothetical protein
MYYLTSPADFLIGERVELHPATDLWMMGARFGTVIKVTRTKVHVKLDAGRTVRMSPTDLAHV